VGPTCQIFFSSFFPFSLSFPFLFPVSSSIHSTARPPSPFSLSRSAPTADGLPSPSQARVGGSSPAARAGGRWAPTALVVAPPVAASLAAEEAIAPPEHLQHRPCSFPSSPTSEHLHHADPAPLPLLGAAAGARSRRRLWRRRQIWQSGPPPAGGRSSPARPGGGAHLLAQRRRARIPTRRQRPLHLSICLSQHPDARGSSSRLRRQRRRSSTLPLPSLSSALPLPSLSDGPQRRIAHARYHATDSGCARVADAFSVSGAGLSSGK
jgi:hypothetical protein